MWGDLPLGGEDPPPPHPWGKTLKSIKIILQIEHIDAVKKIDEIFSVKGIDAYMIGPYDLSGSLKIPGQTSHKLVIDASKRVIDACQNKGISCGTQIANPDSENLEKNFNMGYNFCFLGSDLFSLFSF